MIVSGSIPLLVGSRALDGRNRGRAGVSVARRREHIGRSRREQDGNGQKTGKHSYHTTNKRRFVAHYTSTNLTLLSKRCRTVSWVGGRRV